MSVKNELATSQTEEVELLDLSECERMVVKLFRQLDEVGRKDIICFLNVLVSAK